MASMRKGWRNWSCLLWRRPGRRKGSRDMMTAFKYVRSSYRDNGDQCFPYALGTAWGEFGLICSKVFSKYLFIMDMKHWKGYLERLWNILYWEFLWAVRQTLWEMTQVCWFQAKDSLYFFVEHIQPQTMHHESCRDYLRPNYCISNSKGRRARTSEISRRNYVLHGSYWSSQLLFGERKSSQDQARKGLIMQIH